jgi:hypothetical protein
MQLNTVVVILSSCNFSLMFQPVLVVPDKSAHGNCSSSSVNVQSSLFSSVRLLSFVCLMTQAALLLQRPVNVGESSLLEYDAASLDEWVSRCILGSEA